MPKKKKSDVVARTAVTNNPCPGELTEKVLHDVRFFGMQPACVDGIPRRYHPKPDDKEFPWLLSFVEQTSSPRQSTEIYLTEDGFERLIFWLLSFASEEVLNKATKEIQEYIAFKKERVKTSI